MKHKGTIIIETERLILKKFEIEDAEQVFKNWSGDNEVTKYLRWKKHKNIEETKNILNSWIKSYEDKSFYQWNIYLKEIDESIGTISIVGKNEKTSMLHFGYVIGSKWWNKGYTTEALKSIMPFLFDEVGVNRLESQHEPSNVFSGKVMEKCGFVYEGTLREADYNNDGIVDTKFYSMLKSEWDNLKEK